MPIARSRPLSWTTIWFAWMALALLFLPQSFAINLGQPRPAPLWLVTAHNTAIFAVWALLTPLALRAVRRWPPFAGRQWRHGRRLAAAAVALTLLHLGAMAALVFVLAGGAAPLPAVLLGQTIGLAATDLLVAAALFAIGIAQLHFEGRRSAETLLAQARLAALRQQLQPHFLFNTLNALAELVHVDAHRAEAMLLRLSALLRRALDDGERFRISLREELDFLDDYLAIQQDLFAERLRIVREVDPAALDDALPPMLLQPLVENALRHGLAPRIAGGTLTLAAQVHGNRLHLRIADDGIGATLPLRNGVGLGNTLERLRSEYGDAATMAIVTAAGAGAGFECRLVLPRERP